MRSLLLLLAGCTPTAPYDVDLSRHWGTWATTSPAATAFAAYDVSLHVDGITPEGGDSTFEWWATIAHSDASNTPGCTGTLAVRGDWIPACDTGLVPDPTSTSFPKGANTDGGCLSLEVAEASFRRQDCDATDHDLPLGPLPEDVGLEAFAAMDWAAVGDGELWLGWEPEVVLARCKGAAGCGPPVWPE